MLSAALVSNFALVQFLGLCPFMGISNRLDTALPMGLATAFVLVTSSVAAFALQRHLLAPFDFEYLRLPAFIVAIAAAAVQFTEAFVRATSPLLHRLLGVYLPLIASNCAVLGVALIATDSAGSLAEVVALALGAAAGFALVLACFAALRERLDRSGRAGRGAGHPAGACHGGHHGARVPRLARHRAMIAALVMGLLGAFFGAASRAGGQPSANR